MDSLTFMEMLEDVPLPKEHLQPYNRQAHIFKASQNRPGVQNILAQIV